MRYIDEDLQNIYRRTIRRLQNEKKYQQQLPTTPFTASELQTLTLNTLSFSDKLKVQKDNQSTGNKLLVSEVLFFKNIKGKDTN
jgi:hypothetical protein